MRIPSSAAAALAGGWYSAAVGAGVLLLLPAPTHGASASASAVGDTSGSASASGGGSRWMIPEEEEEEEEVVVALKNGSLRGDLSSSSYDDEDDGEMPTSEMPAAWFADEDTYEAEAEAAVRKSGSLRRPSSSLSPSSSSSSDDVKDEEEMPSAELPLSFVDEDEDEDDALEEEEEEESESVALEKNGGDDEIEMPTAEVPLFVEAEAEGFLLEEDELPSAEQRRDLRRMVVSQDFTALSCNSDLATAACTPLSSHVTGSGGNTVVIPCGQCAYVDYVDGETIDFAGGIDVVGRLTFPSTANVVLRTTHLFVHGQFDMEAPSAGKKVTIQFYGTQDKFLNPAGDCWDGTTLDLNCATQYDVGTKPFVVAGGKLDINAIDPTCPSWTKLKTLSAPQENILQMDGTFETEPLGSVDLTKAKTKWGTAVITVETDPDNGNKYLSFADRSKEWMNLMIRLDETKVIAGDLYTFSFRYKTSDPTVSATGNVPKGWVDSNVNTVVKGFPTCEAEYDDDGQGGTVLTGWTRCTSYVTISSTHDSSQDTWIRWSMRYPTTVDMYYDDVRFELRNPWRTASPSDAQFSTGNCMDTNDELVLTSHSVGGWDKDTLLTVKGVNGYGDIKINEMLGAARKLDDATPALDALAADETDFAVELARLSRRVVFEDGNLMIWHSPNIAQKISGVEMRRFGQQEGTVERYPLHFNMSGTVDPATVVSKNVLRESNAGCIALRGTDGVDVHDNVAYDTKSGTTGCMALVDGSETGNAFTDNLVVKTNAESAFWIGNPSNDFSGNVAAGSKNDGFKFATESSAQTLPLGKFENNAAHSNGGSGVVLYSPSSSGWQPTTSQTLKDMKSYKNNENGVSLLVCARSDAGVFLEDNAGAIDGTAGQPGFFVQTEAEGSIVAFGGTCSQVNDVINGCTYFCPNVCLRKLYVTAGSLPEEEEYKMVVTKVGSGGSSSMFTKIALTGRFEALLPMGDYSVHFQTAAGTPTQVYPPVTEVRLGPSPVCSGYITESNVEIEHRAQWMSGKHGLGWRIPGGAGVQSALYQPSVTVSQIQTHLPEISYVIVGLSSGAYGDTYNGPHEVLSNLNRGSTSVTSSNVPSRVNFETDPSSYLSQNMTAASVAKDTFGDLLDQFAINDVGGKKVKVIAYMASQGPLMGKAGDAKCFDYMEDGVHQVRYQNHYFDCTPYQARFKDSTKYHNNCRLNDPVDPDSGCALSDPADPNSGYIFDGCINYCNDFAGKTSCAPSIYRWKEYVASVHYGRDTYTDKLNPPVTLLELHQAYADIIVKHYAQRYKGRVHGWWFDQANSDYADAASIVNAVRSVDSTVVVGYNDGTKVPLRNNNPGFEDFTFGHVTPISRAPPNACANYGMIRSAESSEDGYVYQDVGAADCSNAADAPSYSYAPPTTSYKSAGDGPDTKALAHVFMPVNDNWNNGDAVWSNNPDQAKEWMKRVVDAKGAWTWNLKKCPVETSSCPGVYDGTLDTDDVTFLKSVYAGLDSVPTPYTYNEANSAIPNWDEDTQCVCTPFVPTTTTTAAGCSDDSTWTYRDGATTIKTCADTSWLTETRCCRECGYGAGATADTDAIVANRACGCACAAYNCDGNVPENTDCVLGQNNGKWDPLSAWP